MCLSIPAKVISTEGDYAEVSVGGTVFKAGLQLVEGIVPGDYVLLHAGFAIGKLSLEEAAETIEILSRLGDADQYSEL